MHALNENFHLGKIFAARLEKLMEVKCWLSWFRAQYRELALGYVEIPGADLEEESFWTKITLVGWVTVVLDCEKFCCKIMSVVYFGRFPSIFKECFWWFDFYVVLRYFLNTVRLGREEKRAPNEFGESWTSPQLGELRSPYRHSWVGNGGMYGQMRN